MVHMVGAIMYYLMRHEIPWLLIVKRCKREIRVRRRCKVVVALSFHSKLRNFIKKLVRSLVVTQPIRILFVCCVYFTNCAQHSLGKGSKKKWYLSLREGFKKKKSGIFQIGSTHPCNRRKSGKKNKIFIVLKWFLGNFEQFWKNLFFHPRKCQNT